MRPTLLFKFVSLTVAGLLLAGLDIAMTGAATKRIEHGAAAINLAGQERYRSYELHALALRLAADPDDRELRATLRARQDRFERILTGLIDGDPAATIEPAADPAVRAALERAWATYRAKARPLLDAILRPDGGGHPGATAALGEVVGEVVRQVDAAVGLYEARVRSEARSIDRLQWIFIGLRVLATVVTLVLVAAWIVLPVRRLGRAMRDVTEGRLDAELAGHGRDEIGDLFDGFNRMANALARRTEETFRAARLLRVQSITDGLTGVYNRRYFDSAAQQEFERARRYDLAMSVILVDVDHFKTFNDVHGHVAGDQALRGVAQALLRTARASDAICRFGGEEFAILAPATALDGARVLGEKLRREVERSRMQESGIPGPTISVGVASLEPGDRELKALVGKADYALYAAKRGGRNRVETADRAIACGPGASPP